jgi:hypothetical protein
MTLTHKQVKEMFTAKDYAKQNRRVTVSDVQTKANAWERYPLVLGCAENGTLTLEPGTSHGWELLTPDGVPFQVLRCDDLYIAFHNTRLEDGELWWLYLTGDCWHSPIQVHGSYDSDPEPHYVGLNEAVKRLLTTVELLTVEDQLS